MRICKRGKSACSVAKSDTLPAHVSCYDNEQPLKVIVMSKKAVREATCQ